MGLSGQELGGMGIVMGMDMNRKSTLKFLKLLIVFFLWAHGFSAQMASTQTVSTIYGLGLQPLVEISNQGQTQVLNIFAPRGQVLAQVVNSETRYLLADHRRSTRIVLKEDNNLLGSFDYTPYGETNAMGDVDSVPYRYTGQPVNFGLNSYHFYQREYDPNILRFTSVDPSHYNESPYIYSNSNPSNFMDPTGGQPEDVVLWLHGGRSSATITFASGYNHQVRTAPPVEGKSSPIEIVSMELPLTGNQPMKLFSEDVRLKSIVVTAHGNPEGILVMGVDGQESLGPEDFFRHLIRRVSEIDVTGVKQVETITLYSCRVGCSEEGQPSFAKRFFDEALRRAEVGEPHFPNLDRVVSSPYKMSLMSLKTTTSNKDIMNIEFSTALKWSEKSKSYFTDNIDIQLNTAQFLSGDGVRAIRGTNEVTRRRHYRTLEEKKSEFFRSDTYHDAPMDDSGTLSFPTFFLQEDSL